MSIEQRLKERLEKNRTDALKLVKAAAIAAATGDGRINDKRLDEIADALTVLGWSATAFDEAVGKYRQLMALQKACEGHAARKQEREAGLARANQLKEKVEAMQAEERQLRANYSYGGQADAAQRADLDRLVRGTPWLFTDAADVPPQPAEVRRADIEARRATLAAAG